MGGVLRGKHGATSVSYTHLLCRDCLIPRFTLQPLVENAIFHGLEPKGGHGSVLLDISTDPDTGDVLLRITDEDVYKRQGSC